MLNAVVLVFHIAVSLTLIVLILLHAGRGGGLSDMFGGGSLGGSMAGSTVVERNLDRITVIIATDLRVHHHPARVYGLLRARCPAGTSDASTAGEVSSSESYRSVGSPWSRWSQCWRSCWPRAAVATTTRARAARRRRRRARRRRPAGAARSSSAPSRSLTAPTGSPAAPASSWGALHDAGADDAAGLRLS